MENTDTCIRTERDLVDYLDNGVVGLHWVAADGTILWANRADVVAGKSLYTPARLQRGRELERRRRYYAGYY
jgi:hypothetical protein